MVIVAKDGPRLAPDPEIVIRWYVSWLFVGCYFVRSTANHFFFGKRNVNWLPCSSCSAKKRMAFRMHCSVAQICQQQTSSNMQLTVSSPAFLRRRQQTMSRSEATSRMHQEQRLQTCSNESAGMILVTTTIHMALWLLGSSIGGTASPQSLPDDALTLALAFLWL